MIIYSEEKRFSPKTGKELGSDYGESGLICDYTGKVIDQDNYEDRPMYGIKIQYNSDCEEVYYYDKEKEYFDKIGVNYYSLFGSEYHFLVGSDGQDYSSNLLDEWSRDFKKKDSVFFECLTIEEALRRARVRTVKKLLEEKKYTVEELGLVWT